MTRASVLGYGLSEREQPEKDRMVAEHAQMCERAEQRKRKRDSKAQSGKKKKKSKKEQSKASSRGGGRRRGRG